MSNILVTAGAMIEPIDGVRYISNTSSGETGRQIAHSLAEAGLKVDLIMGSTNSGISHTNIENFTFTNFVDLQQKLALMIGGKKYSHIIHLAAVSDFSLDYIEQNGVKLEANKNIKISSAETESLAFNMKKNPKLISMLKDFTTTDLQPQVIGFKLTNKATDKTIQTKIQTLFEQGGIDFIVHNDLSNIDKNSHAFKIFNNKTIINHGSNKAELSLAILQIIQSEKK